MSDKLVLVSNRLVHLNDEVVSAAWIVSQLDEEELLICILLVGITKVNLYCAKLEGIFHALQQLAEVDI